MNVYQDVIMAGFGGQGVMLIGNLLAYAGMDAGFNVTFIPVYGPEMRGGTANCTVVVSDEDIGSPVIHRPKGIIVMNQPSLEKFQPRVEDGGVIIINSSLIDARQADTSGRIRAVIVAANDIANDLGNARMANMVIFGAYIKAVGTLPMKAVTKALHHVFPKESLI
ncbi:MAG: 2-oxoacid:acceptor oxidoreductase family protein, partial [Deltaproteobacteria bacterium]|nr:2-oxoacid:acceptor oxidoreductase family protein [Deltaproteobacteria bacterium]